MNESVYRAMSWLKAILDGQGVRYQIVGGFAAHLHGGSRPIADIDLYIKKEDVNALLPFFQPFVSKPLKHYREEGWDLEYLQLIYENQKIEIGLSPGTKIFNTSSQQWVSLDVDLAESVQRDFHGLALPVININSLIEYKRVLNREVDRIDIRELEDIQQAENAQTLGHFSSLFDIARRKAKYDNTNTWYKGSETYFDALYQELEKVGEEITQTRLCYLEDELGDVLWNYLNLLMALEKEQGIDPTSVLSRAVNKYQQRVATNENNGSWADVKAEQKRKLQQEYLGAMNEN
ncbi:MAG: hypothetical protein MK214_06295 [Thalassotalea sp.]|nr:hypothetical protein [Thalassotalea sp.]